MKWRITSAWTRRPLPGRGSTRIARPQSVLKEVEIRMAPEDSGRSQEANRALFRRMVLSHFDLQETQKFLDRLQPVGDVAAAGQDDVVVRTALMTALLVSYWR